MTDELIDEEEMKKRFDDLLKRMRESKNKLDVDSNENTKFNEQQLFAKISVDLGYGWPWGQDEKKKKKNKKEKTNE